MGPGAKVALNLKHCQSHTILKQFAIEIFRLFSSLWISYN